MSITSRLLERAATYLPSSPPTRAPAPFESAAADPNAAHAGIVDPSLIPGSSPPFDPVFNPDFIAKFGPIRGTDLATEAANAAYQPRGDLTDLTIPTDLDAATTQQMLADNQRTLFNREFAPDETQLLNNINNPADVRNAGFAAADSASQGLDSASRFMGSRLASTGQRITPGQQAVIARRAGLARALTRSRAFSNAADTRANNNLGTLKNVLDIARGISTGATQNASTAAGLQAAREQALRQAQAQQAQQNTSLAGTAASAAFMYWLAL